METIELLLKELETEAVTTKKMLNRVPMDRLDWQPHPKSMTLKNLSTHVAELPSWISLTLNTSELDFATSPYTPADIKSTEDLLSLFEKSLEEGKSELSQATSNQLEEMWTLRNGEEIYSTSSKYDVIRMSLSQVIHHRAQLGVYLRLLNIPIPGSYGPSADEVEFNNTETATV